MLRRLFSAGGGDEAIEIQLRGHDLARGRALAALIERRVAAVPGVVEVDSTEREGRLEENLRFRRTEIYGLGLAVEDVARAVQTAVGGSRAGYFRDVGEQLPITVRLRPNDRLTVEDLRGIAVRTPDNQMVPVSALVERERGRGPSEIRHLDGQRAQYITANLESGVALGDAVARIRAELADVQLPTGFSIVYGGAYQEQQQSQRDFLVTILMAIVLVYMVMAGQFERFLDPLVVMVSVPLAAVGVVLALLVTRTTLNVQSIMGVVMLVGIVVNNAIVLVDYINLKRREDGLEVREAATRAGRARLRPILMTTSTTVLGLMPLALGLGAGAGMQAALARVVVGGLLTSTLVTLFVVPTLYVSATTWSERTAAAVRQWRETPMPASSSAP